jgi:NADP-dependent 3-hydroxy acid dehydrogenase YdfG
MLACEGTDFATISESDVPVVVLHTPPRLARLSKVRGRISNRGRPVGNDEECILSGSRFSNRVVVVTGASSGVGRAISRALGREGARVGLIARGVEGLSAAADEIRQGGGEALVLPLDLADASAVQSAADQVVGTWGAIDVWVNDAMVSVFAPISDTTPEEFRRVMEVNYLGTVHGTLAALRHMRARDAGVVVQIGSALAYRSIPLQSAYCASKAAIRGFTDSLRSELAHERSRIKVTMLQLPAVNTPQFEVVRNKLGKHARPVPPTYQPEVVARAVLYAIEHPSREMWVGWPTIKAILGQKVIPGLLDHYLARMAWNAQVTKLLPLPNKDNLHAPLPGDRGARGSFDKEARSFSAELWIRTHRGTTAACAALLALLGITAVRKLLRVSG